MVNVAVLGYGTVGSGVVEVLRTNKDVIAERVGTEVNVKYVLDLREFPGSPIEDILVHDYQIILDSPEVDIVVEVMGGVEPAFTFVKKALEAGKNVCTSNKALVAAKGSELLAIAREKNINFMFEASVGGGIPIIRALNECLTGDVIEEIQGIINGTTNYMLSKMYFEGAEYDAVLKDAQAKGYAELHPEADVEGYDACRKIAILSSIISGKFVDYEEIYTEGITEITPADIAYAKAMGRQIKLLATSKRQDGSIAAMVAPFMVAPEHPLSTVNGVFNAVFVRGNMLGDGMFYGSGAGKLPTASAVVGDVVECAKNLHVNLIPGWADEKLELVSTGDVAFRFFVRAEGCACEMEEVKNVFGEVEAVDAGIEGEIGFVTAVMPESEYKEKAEKLSGILHMIRMEG